MALLERHKQFSETAQRLRWITCLQLEKTMSGLFPFAQVCPFGSSVNGCGHNGSDLDVVLSLSGYNTSPVSAAHIPLVFHAKPVAGSNARGQMQRHMEVISGILKHFSTGCTQVEKCFFFNDQSIFISIFTLNDFADCKYFAS